MSIAIGFFRICRLLRPRVRALGVGVSIIFFLGVGATRSVFAVEPTPAPQKPVLSILSLTNVLSSSLVLDFETQHNVNVRVDFVGAREEFEARLRQSPRSWHLVFADERHLRSLTLARLLKQIPAGRVDVAARFPLEHPSRLNEEGRAYLPVMADPLGIAWVRETREASLPASWSWLSDPALNPLWRGRIYFPSSIDFQFWVSLKVAGRGSPSEIPPAAISWIRQVRPHTLSVRSGFLKEALGQKCVAGAVWYSEYLKFKKFIPALEFGVPKEGSYFERYGLALVADASNEDDLAIQFLSYVVEHRDEMARAVQMLPLSAEKFEGMDVASWSLFEDDLPFSKGVESELKKLVEGRP